jgi:hypothetical protein
MASSGSPRRFSLKWVLKILFFPFLFMVNPKIYFMGKEDVEP